MKVRLQTNDDMLHIHSRYLYSMNGALIHFAVSGCLLVRLDHNRRFLCRNFRGNNRSLIYVLKLKASVVGWHAVARYPFSFCQFSVRGKDPSSQYSTSTLTLNPIAHSIWWIHLSFFHCHGSVRISSGPWEFIVVLIDGQVQMPWALLAIFIILMDITTTGRSSTHNFRSGCFTQSDSFLGTRHLFFKISRGSSVSSTETTQDEPNYKETQSKNDSHGNSRRTRTSFPIVATSGASSNERATTAAEKSQQTTCQNYGRRRSVRTWSQLSI